MKRRLSINWPVVEKRRIAAGLSRDELATRLGSRAASVSYLWPSRSWRDAEQGNLRLQILEYLCQILDLGPAELFIPPDDDLSHATIQPSTSKADDAVLEAALATVVSSIGHTQMAQALGWSLERVERAVEKLEERLAFAGVRLDRDAGAPAVLHGLKPRDALLTDGQRSALRTHAGLDGQLSEDDAATLYEIAVVQSAPTESSSRIDRDAAVRLQQRRYVYRRHGSERLIPRPDVLFGLRLDDR